jgi:hypothetical protein
LLAAENESSPDLESKVEGEPIEDKSTQELMSILDTAPETKAPVNQNDKETLIRGDTTQDEVPQSDKRVPGDEEATKHKALESSDSDKKAVNASPAEKAAPTEGKKSAAAAERDRVRLEIMNNFFGAEIIKDERPTTDDKKNKPGAARKAKVAARKYAVPDLEQPTKKSKGKSEVVVDPFAAQFAARATSHNRAADPNAPLGFFDTLPSEKKSKAQKKSTNSSGSGNKKKKSGRR